MEWYGFQLRDDYAGRWSLQEEKDVADAKSRRTILLSALRNTHTLKTGSSLLIRTELLNTGSPTSIMLKRYKRIMIQFVISLSLLTTTSS